MSYEDAVGVVAIWAEPKNTTAAVHAQGAMDLISALFNVPPEEVVKDIETRRHGDS